MTYSKEQKPLGVKNYGSIPHLLGSKLGKHDKFITEGQSKILTEKTRDKHDMIFVTEKLDGTNVGVTKIDGRLITLTRSGYKCSKSQYFQHHSFDKWVNKPENYNRLMNAIPEGGRIVGEWLHKLNTIQYDIVGDPFYLLDTFGKNNNRFPYQFTREAGRLLGLKTPVLIHQGEAIAIKKAWKLLDIVRDHRFTNKYKPEGLVYRCERKNNFDFMAKWVRDDFEPGLYLDQDLKNKFNV